MVGLHMVAVPLYEPELPFSCGTIQRPTMYDTRIMAKGQEEGTQTTGDAGGRRTSVVDSRKRAANSKYCAHKLRGQKKGNCGCDGQRRAKRIDEGRKPCSVALYHALSMGWNGARDYKGQQ